jgi:hypothetical protein
MPLNTFWGATIDRSEPGFVTLTLDGVVVRTAWDSTKASKSDILAAFLLLNEYVPLKEVLSGDLWDYRCQYARFAWKVLAYGDIAASLPGNQRAPWTAKQNRCATFRDQYKALAGE